MGVRGSGHYYFEATMMDEGICRVGWATQAASFNLGTDVHGVGYGGTAKKSHKGQFLDYGTTYGKGDVVGCVRGCGVGWGDVVGCVSRVRGGTTPVCALTAYLPPAPPPPPPPQLFPGPGPARDRLRL